MYNPDTRLVESYEEIWIDKQIEKGNVSRNETGNEWAGYAGDYEIGLGIENGKIWAYQVQGGVRKSTELPEHVAQRHLERST